MTNAPIPPDDDQILIDQREYRALVAATSAPGRDLAAEPGDQLELLWACLVDVHVRAWDEAVDARANLAIAEFCRFTTDPGHRLGLLHDGRPSAPEDGATAVIASDHTTRVRLAGPGVEHQFETWLPISAEALQARNLACQLPFGIDLYLVGADHRALIALPRSTQIEVLI